MGSQRQILLAQADEDLSAASLAKPWKQVQRAACSLKICIAASHTLLQQRPTGAAV
jgi:hypothetical protein